jgi:hypothetical protein
VMLSARIVIDARWFSRYGLTVCHGVPPYCKPRILFFVTPEGAI